MNPDRIFNIIGENDVAKAFVFAGSCVLFFNWLLEMNSEYIHMVMILTTAFYIKMKL